MQRERNKEVLKKKQLHQTANRACFMVPCLKQMPWFWHPYVMLDLAEWTKNFYLLLLKAAETRYLVMRKGSEVQNFVECRMPFMTRLTSVVRTLQQLSWSDRSNYLEQQHGYPLMYSPGDGFTLCFGREECRTNKQMPWFWHPYVMLDLAK